MASSRIDHRSSRPGSPLPAPDFLLFGALCVGLAGIALVFGLIWL